MPDTTVPAIPFIGSEQIPFIEGATYSIRVTTISGAIATLSVSGLTKAGVFNFRPLTTNDRVFTQTTFRIPDFPLFLSISDVVGGLVPGDCWAAADLLINGNKVLELTAGLVYSQKSVDYPASNATDAMPGRGLIKAVTSADPAAGSELSISCPNGAIWKILHGGFTLVCAAVAGSRRVHLQVNDGGTRTTDMFGNTDQIISETKRYSFADYGVIQDETDDNDILINIPADLYLLGGNSLVTVTTNKNAGDNFGALEMLVEEWLVGTS